MDSLGKTIAQILIVSLIAGVIIVLCHPMYRGTARAMFHGAVTNTPIWRSNAEYCPTILPERVKDK